MNRVVVVTGGGSGIGEATARRMSAAGDSVIVVDIDASAAARVAASLPGEALSVGADVAVEADVRGYMEAAVERFGRLDCFHLNAGVLGGFESLVDLSADAFDKVVNVNLRGTFLGIREGFRQFARQASGGSIVATASISALRASPDTLAYQASKHGLVGLVRGAAMYGAPFGIRVNAVAPGLIQTAIASTPTMREEMVRRASTTPIRRIGTADEVASVVEFLLGDGASFITGEVVTVDGGASIANAARPSAGAGLWSTEALDAQTRDEFDRIRRMT